MLLSSRPKEGTSHTKVLWSIQKTRGEGRILTSLLLPFFLSSCGLRHSYPKVPHFGPQHTGLIIDLMWPWATPPRRSGWAGIGKFSRYISSLLSVKLLSQGTHCLLRRRGKADKIFFPFFSLFFHHLSPLLLFLCYSLALQHWLFLPLLSFLPTCSSGLSGIRQVSDWRWRWNMSMCRGWSPVKSSIQTEEIAQNPQTGRDLTDF